MTIGEELKRQRLSLGLNRKQFANGIINDSYLAYVENGKSEIRASDLLAILKQNKLSVLSFLASLGDVQTSFAFYEQEADAAFFDHNLLKLKKLSDSCPNTVIKDVMQLMIAKLNDNFANFPNYIKAKIRKTLWETESWTPDSLWIFSNAMEIYNFDELEGLVSSLIHNFSKFSKYDDRIIKLLATITLNYLQICLSQGKVQEQEVIKASDYLAKMPAISIITFEKMKGKYLLAIYRADNQTAAKIDKVLKKSIWNI